MVLNFSDILERWTNGMLLAGVHRVVLPRVTTVSLAMSRMPRIWMLTVTARSCQTGLDSFFFFQGCTWGSCDSNGRVRNRDEQGEVSTDAVQVSINVSRRNLCILMIKHPQGLGASFSTATR